MKYKLNKKTSELIGAHVGDGSLYRTNNGLVWELRGDLRESAYYEHMKQLLFSIFKIELNVKIRNGGKNGCLGIQTSKRDITSFFLEFGFHAGRKTHSVRIPDYIFDSDKKVQFAFARGLFDTAGCLRFDKNHGKAHKYPKIEFSSASENLIFDLSELLSAHGFKNHVWKDRDSYKLYVAGNKMLKKFMKEVKPKNSKHLNKYIIFQKSGKI